MRRSVFTGGTVLGTGQTLSRALSFVRNVIVARLIAPEDFGVAATFAITVSLLEMVSDLAADKLIIQAKDGDEPRLQATAQLWQFGRGLASAMLICALAWPTTMLFEVPQARWAFYWLALVPLLRGLLHLDVRRLQRHMRFAPMVATELGSQLLVVLLAWPLAAWLRDYSAMLWLLIAQSATLALLSHLLAERPYRWDWDPGSARRLFSFGWPLLINGLLMFGVFQGDRLIVGAGYSMEDLGVYSVAFALTLTPTLMLAAFSGSLLLPLLSRVQDDQEELARRYTLCAQVLALAAGMIAVPFIVVGGKLVTLVYGDQYQAAAAFIGCLGAMQAVRLFRVATTLAAMSRADTLNSLFANCYRVLGVAGALGAALLHLPLVWIAACGLVGEILAFVASALRLRRRQGLNLAASMLPAGLVSGVLAVAGMAGVWDAVTLGWTPATLVTGGLMLAVPLLMCAALSELRAEARYLLFAHPGKSRAGQPRRFRVS